MKLKLILVLLLVLQCANAGELARITLDGGITLNVSKFISNRSLPHAFYDQAMSSIPLLYPDYMIYAKRRQGKLGKLDYSLICYKQTRKSAQVTISGAAVSGTDAWSFETTVPESSFGDALLRVIEAITKLPAGN
jgi:hypothetical protein